MNLKQQLARFRHTAYHDTVASRGKSSDWWTRYTEEWKQPPTPGTIQALGTGWLSVASYKLWRVVFRRAALLVFSSIPVFGVLAYSSFTALDYARRAHAPMFAAKHMSPKQVDVWIEERRTSYWLFGFAAQTLERVPFLGMLFSVSNRIGAAMWAHDLEKRQQRFQAGELEPMDPRSTHIGRLAPRADAPGSYGHPDAPEAAIPGDFHVRAA